MKKLVLGKLKSNSGESIAETLVAVLIAAFALLMLAGTVNTASNLITKSQNVLAAYYENNNSLADPDGDALVTVKASGTIVLQVDNVPGKKVTSNIGGKDLISYGG